MQLVHSLEMVNGIGSNLAKWQRLMKPLAEIFTPANSLPTTSFPLMVILSQGFFVSWSLRSISFGADLQPSIDTFSCSDDFDEHGGLMSLRECSYWYPSSAIVADCVRRLCQGQRAQSNLALESPNLRHEAPPLAKRGGCSPVLCHCSISSILTSIFVGCSIEHLARTASNARTANSSPPFFVNAVFA